jgi:tripartite-type tricarboxylate transporter receptor subunit TctC
MTKQMRYDAVEAFDWVGQIATAGLLIVTRPDSPYKDIKSLVEAARANPGKINFASPGYGATQHLAAELFKQVAGVSAQQVQYRTSPEALAALLSQNVDVLFDTVTALLGQVQSGQVRALGVTGKDRFPAVPDVPAAIESGVVPNYDVTTWYGLFGPKGMPPAAIAKLNTALNEMLEEPTIRERLIKAGVLVKSSTPQAWRQFMIDEHAKWSKVREAAKLEQR